MYEWYFAILWMKVEWWRHSNPTCCNQICLNLTHSQAVGILKHPLVPEPPCEILTAYFFTIFHFFIHEGSIVLCVFV